MQIKLTLSNINTFTIPINYNYQVQSAIYQLLKYDRAFSAYIHNVGFGNPKLPFKLFTFGQLNGHCAFRDKKLVFGSDISLEIRSSSEQFCDILKKALLKHGTMTLFDTQLPIKMIEVTDRHITAESVQIRTLSPIVAKAPEENGKSIYYSPENEMFQEAVNHNFQRKFAVYFRRPPEHKLEIQPMGYIRKVVTSYKGIWITAYHGDFTLSGESAGLDFLYQTGLGGRNAQGFGMFELTNV